MEKLICAVLKNVMMMSIQGTGNRNQLSLYSEQNLEEGENEYLPPRDTKSSSRKLLKEPSTLLNKKKLLIGLAIVLIIACSWVGATQTAKSSYTKGFSAPFFVTWFTTSWMVLVFPLAAPIYFITRRTKLSKATFGDLLRYTTFSMHCTIEIYSSKHVHLSFSYGYAVIVKHII